MFGQKEQGFSISKTKLSCDCLLSLFCCLLYSIILLEYNHVNTNKYVYKPITVTPQGSPEEHNYSIGYQVTNEIGEKEAVYKWHETILKMEQTLGTTQNHFDTLQILLTAIVLAICIRAVLSLLQNLIEGMPFENLILDPGVLIDLLSGAFVLVSPFASSPVTLFVPLFLQSFNARNAFILLLLKYRSNSADIISRNSTFLEWTVKTKLHRVAMLCDTICVLYCIATLQFYLETICMDWNAETIYQLLYDWLHSIARDGLFYAFNPFAYFGRLSLLSTSVLFLALPEIRYKSKILC